MRQKCMLQIWLAETMTLKMLLTGLEPKLGQIARESDPKDILTAENIVRRELQLNNFKT